MILATALHWALKIGHHAKSSITRLSRLNPCPLPSSYAEAPKILCDCVRKEGLWEITGSGEVLGWSHHNGTDVILREKDTGASTECLE